VSEIAVELTEQAIRDGLARILAEAKAPRKRCNVYIDEGVYFRMLAEACHESRLAGLREAAAAARNCQTFDWKGGEEWAAGYVDGKNAAATAILALAEGKEG
jgi:hypothetical protein